jgi:hypothetical protein
MKNSGLRFSIRNLKSKILNPGFGECLRCKGSWNIVRGHDTPYRETSRVTISCFLLCETCWKELGTPEARLPYYRKFVFELSEEEIQQYWPAIQTSVLAGN